VLRHNRFHVALMLYTALAVIVTDFLSGVLSAILLSAALRRFFDHPTHLPLGWSGGVARPSRKDQPTVP